ncbi:hypothetical protein [Streptomyces sp. NPDC060194]|uniref:MGH1-like glycoside hydrolase domain-containing protein n=1 Tax=Streptomyces sp. NPDC060194 TaxID=3347069 RepID=UPI00365F5026
MSPEPAGEPAVETAPTRAPAPSPTAAEIATEIADPDATAPEALSPTTSKPWTAADPDTWDQLRRAAAWVLLGNWAGGSTVPSRTLYPHQWSWDTAFIAIGLRHLSPRRASRELETLFAAQWPDGRVPHIVFNDSVAADAYFPGPDFWQAGVPGEGGQRLHTSGIVQPPVHALAAWLTHRADPEDSVRRGVPRRLYPRLAAWHDYLLAHRDLGGAGLAAIVHPWESGMDNSPCWDGPLARVTPADPASYVRRDLAHANPADRPTDLDYGRYVRLCADYRAQDYDDTRTAHAFAVEDPCFNALLAVSEAALAQLAEVAGADPGPHLERALALRQALLDRLWDPGAGQFLCRDLRAPDRPLIDGRSISGLVPLILPDLPPDVSEALLATVRGDHFGLGKAHLVPSYDLQGPAFDPSRYWRGPSWFNTAWLVHRGLGGYGAEEEAKRLREALLDAAGRTNFSEYLDPYTGEGRGIWGFSWTAATALDLLAQG